MAGREGPVAVHGAAGAPQAMDAGRVIRRAPGIAAFLGRTLKGPVDRPVPVGSFADFQRSFGGLWQPSTLSYAVEQFFDNGGRGALIVRLVNGARAPTLTLPAGAGCLRLTGVHPGSREHLRAAVDHDGIGTASPHEFNLVVQRLAAPGTEQVSEQEILRRLSVDPGAARFVGAVLEGSQLVRVLGEVPGQRPERTPAPPGAWVGYVNANPDGDDGAPLCDYDLIGSAARGSGLFALDAGCDFDLLYLPPLTREQDLGLSTLLVAARFCRERHATLVVDPPQSWTRVEDVLTALPRWPFRSDSAAMFFPRIEAMDRLRNRETTFPPGAAAAGWLSRSDAARSASTSIEVPEVELRPALRAALAVGEQDGERLAQLGVNTLQPLRPAGRRRARPCTLSVGRPGGDGRALAAQRLAAFIAAGVERGTRWVRDQPNIPATWERAGAQVAEFLESLRREGAFAAADAADCWFVISDERVNRPHTVADGAVNVLFGYAPVKPADFQCWLVTHRGGAGRVRRVTVNRLATAPERVDWEIETAILRG